MPMIGLAVPCYNEANRLPVHAFTDFITRNQDFIFCFVNDGSRDHTAEVLLQMAAACPERIAVINRGENKGKGESIREGINYLMMYHKVAYVGFLDADLATPLSEMEAPAEIIRSNRYSMVCGSRVKRMGASIDRYAVRHIIGRFCHAD